MKKPIGALLVAAVFGLVSGCSSEAADRVGEANQELGAECANAQENGYFSDGANVTSPSTYGEVSCASGLVYDIFSYSANLGTNSSGALSTLVKWADAVPSLADCEHSWVESDLFKASGAGAGGTSSFAGAPSGGSGWTHIGNLSGWGAIVNGKCWVPSVTWTTEMAPGGMYRISVSALAPSGATRSVSVHTYVDSVLDKCVNLQVDDDNVCTTDKCVAATGVISHAYSRAGLACPLGICNGYGACVRNPL